MSQQVEPILQENKDRFVIFPIQHHDIWEWYKKSEASYCKRKFGRKLRERGSIQ